MAEHDINIIAEQLDSLHAKILNSKFAEQVTESEVWSLYLAVTKINNQAAEIESLKIKNMHLAEFLYEKEQECEFHKQTIAENAQRALEVTLEEIQKARKDIAERVKLAFYYHFEELIPSIMEDEIDKILKELESENDG